MSSDIHHSAQGAKPNTAINTDTGSKLASEANSELEIDCLEKMKLNEIAAIHYQWVDEMGWHNKTPLEALALVASEVGEAVNECRGEQPTENFGEELADIVLRVIDLAHWQGVDINAEIIAKIAKNKTRGNRGRLK